MTDDRLELSSEEARIDAILRSMTEDDLELHTPPDGLWDQIEAVVAADSATTSASARVIDFPMRFSRRPLARAAVAAALILVIGALVVTSGSDGPDYEVVGEAGLEWADGFVDAGVDATASASMLLAGDTNAVRLDQTDLPAAPEGEDLELWLIGVDSAGELTIQTLGLIDDPSDDRTYEIPAGFEPDSFDAVLVDISFEPRDGDATHSGASVVRGPIVGA